MQSMLETCRKRFSNQKGFAVACGYNDAIVRQDHIIFIENVYQPKLWTWDNRNFHSEILGQRIIEAVVLKDSYGKKRQQHTFTLLVTGCVGYNPIKIGKKILRKEATVFRLEVIRKEWENEEERSLLVDDAMTRKHRAKQRRIVNTIEYLYGNGVWGFIGVAKPAV